MLLPVDVKLVWLLISDIYLGKVYITCCFIFCLKGHWSTKSNHWKWEAIICWVFAWAVLWNGIITSTCSLSFPACFSYLVLRVLQSAPVGDWTKRRAENLIAGSISSQKNCPAFADGHSQCEREQSPCGVHVTGPWQTSLMPLIQ